MKVSGRKRWNGKALKSLSMLMNSCSLQTRNNDDDDDENGEDDEHDES